MVPPGIYRAIVSRRDHPGDTLGTGHGYSRPVPKSGGVNVRAKSAKKRVRKYKGYVLEETASAAMPR